MLGKHFTSDTKEYKNYLAVCDRLGKEPDPEKVPMEPQYYPYEVQIAMQIHSLLPDRWDGMSGYYMGKDWSSIDTHLKAHSVEDTVTSLFFIKALEANNMKVMNDNLEKDRKKQEKQQQYPSQADLDKSIIRK